MPNPMIDAFLRAIAEAPADPVPRLVYADWLLEQGEDDAEAFWRWSVKPLITVPMPSESGKSFYWWCLEKNVPERLLHSDIPADLFDCLRAKPTAAGDATRATYRSVRRALEDLEVAWLCRPRRLSSEEEGQ